MASQEEFDAEHLVELNVSKELVEQFWTVFAGVAKAPPFSKLRG